MKPKLLGCLLLLAGLIILAVPAIPCPTCGQLHQVEDCHGQAGEPVMLPEGARIVQPRAQRKPARRRWRLDLTEYAGQITADEVRDLVRAWIAGRDGELEQD